MWPWRIIGGGFFVLLLLTVCAQKASDSPVLLIRMPDEPALTADPSEAQILRFMKERESFLQMTRADVLRDRAFARQVLGQRQIFEELAAFQKAESIPARVRFIAWADAFRFFADYVSDPKNPPVVAQIGDTWAAYFRSLGVVSEQRRHTWDVRVLWYWKDLVAPEQIAEGDGLLAQCERIRSVSPPGLRAPLAIPTAPDWNLLHDLSLWLYNAGLPTVITTEKKWGLLPWREAILAGPEGDRAVAFLTELATRGCLALPEERAQELAEEFLQRKYAMVILGPWFTAMAEKVLGPSWPAQIGATLPPRIGAAHAVTMKGGSLLVLLDPTRGRDHLGVARAQRLLEFLSSPESQKRYAQALGALPAHEEALRESPYFSLFERALQHGRTYPQIPEWAPVVENLATRDNLYAFWKRLSLLTDPRAPTSETERAARARLIRAALYSAEADINRELSPGRVRVLWPWFLTVSGLATVVASLSLWHRRVERKRSEQLRQTRHLLATLQRRLAAVQEADQAHALSESPHGLALKGYPAMYLDAVRRRVLLRRSPAHPLEEVLHGAEYDLFHHIVECLQAGWQQTHWVWSYVIWPTSHPKFPKEAFATHCAKLRKKVETVWQLGRILGRGARQSGVIPIEVKDVHFYTPALPEGDAYPLWALFQASERALKAYQAEDREAAYRYAQQVLTMDPENWLGNTLLCHLALQNHGTDDDPLVQKAIAFAHCQKTHYEYALEKIESLQNVDAQQKNRIRSRYEVLHLIASRTRERSTATSHPKERPPWRDREHLRAWLAYLDGTSEALPEEDLRALREIQRFLRQHLPWAGWPELQEHFRAFLQDLACDISSWPEKKLPRSKRAFQGRALDHVLAGICRLSDDEGSKAITKAQNLRKLWSVKAHLRKTLRDEPSLEQLADACRKRYGWSRLFLERLLQLEQSCFSRSWDEPQSRR